MAHHHPGAGGKGEMNRYALVELPARAIFVIIKEYVRLSTSFAERNSVYTKQ